MDLLLSDLLLFQSVEALSLISEAVAAFIGYIGIAIMLVGCVKGVLLFLWQFFQKENLLSAIRIELGQHLALGLEFLVGKDIIESLVKPTWDDLGKLAAIIALRTFLTLYLSRELKAVKEEAREEELKVKHA